MSRPWASLELTEREIDVLQLLASGMRVSQAARALHIAESTAKLRLKRAYVKLGARNKTHAVALAWRAGLIQ